MFNSNLEDDAMSDGILYQNKESRLWPFRIQGGEMKTIIQAFTGGFGVPSNCSDIAENLVLFTVKSAADAVIIGWNTDVKYDKIISKLHGLNKKVYLWIPVFAEYGNDAITALDYLGNRHENAVSGAVDDFTFACPSETGNIELAVRYYDGFFSGSGFDGVFLDKIRFSSFGNGFMSGMGCFCRSCCDFYNNEGVDTEVFKNLMKNDTKDFLIPCARNDMRYIFENVLIDDLFRARAKLITASVSKIIDMFRKKSLEIGLDVFAPTFAYLFGQDIAALANIADFIKPMIYRVTNAPAGIPYESVHMKAEMLKNGCDIRDKLELLWNTVDLASEECFKNQLMLLKKIPCDVYSGVEVNRSDICSTSAAYVTKSIELIKEAEIAGCVLSWNVLEDAVYP